MQLDINPNVQLRAHVEKPKRIVVAIHGAEVARIHPRRLYEFLKDPEHYPEITDDELDEMDAAPPTSHERAAEVAAEHFSGAADVDGTPPE